MILCVIIHYGNEDVTWECVDSIIENDFMDILVVDNDPEQKIDIPERFKNTIQIIRTGGDASFAHANNMGVSAGRNETHDSVLVLNNDTIVLTDAIQQLKQLLNEEGVGAVCPCMPYASNPENIWACGGIIRKYRVRIRGLNKVMNSKPYDVDYLPGAAILCRLDIWDLVGGLPERYFMAYEEAEFCLNIRKNKYRTMAHPGAKILHKVGMSADNQPMYMYNGIRNRLKFGSVLWGQYPGFLLAMISSFVDILYQGHGLRIWFRAVVDEVSGVALDRPTLQCIKESYDT